MPRVEQSDRELRVPYSRRAVVGALVIFAFIGFFVVVAVMNVVQFRSVSWPSLLASIIWLLGVTIVLMGMARVEGGILPFAALILGHFAYRQFVWIDDNSGHPVVSIGFKLMGKRFHYRQILLSEISSVGWNSGQVSAMSGREVSDWNVVIWYHRSGACPPRQSHRNDEFDLDILGIPDSRETTAAFGAVVVDFFNRAGADLKPDADGCEYAKTREPPDSATLKIASDP